MRGRGSIQNAMVQHSEQEIAFKPGGGVGGELSLPPFLSAFMALKGSIAGEEKGGERDSFYGPRVTTTSKESG